jgi:hypothetical protein
LRRRRSARRGFTTEKHIPTPERGNKETAEKQERENKMIGTASPGLAGSGTEKEHST